MRYTDFIATPVSTRFTNMSSVSCKPAINTHDNNATLDYRKFIFKNTKTNDYFMIHLSHLAFYAGNRISMIFPSKNLSSDIFKKLNIYFVFS